MKLLREAKHDSRSRSPKASNLLPSIDMFTQVRIPNSKIDASWGDLLASNLSRDHISPVKLRRSEDSSPYQSVDRSVEKKKRLNPSGSELIQQLKRIEHSTSKSKGRLSDMDLINLRRSE